MTDAFAEKTALIVASRPIATGALRGVPPGAFVAAADAGWLRARALGLEIDLAVGDFDSSERPPEGRGAKEVLCLPAEKDDTDTHAAARELLRRGWRNIVLLGALGGAPDHHLAVLQTMLYIAKNGGRARAVDEGAQWYCIGPGTPLRLGRGPWNRLGVFAAGGPAAGVYESGVKYPLKDAVLLPDNPLGACNEFAGQEAQIGCKSGCLYVTLYADAGPGHGD